MATAFQKVNLPVCRGHIPVIGNAQSLHPAQAGHTPRACCRAASPVLPAVPGRCRIRPPRLAYGVVFAGNPSKEKAETSRYIKKFQAMFCLNWSLSGQGPPSCWRKTARPLKSPTGAFIAAQTRNLLLNRLHRGEQQHIADGALSVSSMTRRSTPKPRPPVGGRPYSSAFT